jgi:hypothetical protein
MGRLFSSLSAALLLAPSLALAQARVIQFRSAEDPTLQADPAVCASAPFASNLRIDGRLYTYETRGSDGRVMNDDARAIGRATACAQITSLLFPPGLQQKFFLQLTLREGIYTASGTCTIISNDVPRTGLVLAGCNLKLLRFPAGVAGGAVASVSTFNPAHLPGFATGSYWTAQIYDVAAGPELRQDSDRAMEWTEGGDQ